MALNIRPLFPFDHQDVTHPVEDIQTSGTPGERTPTKDEKRPCPDYKVKEEKDRRHKAKLAPPLKKIDII